MIDDMEVAFGLDDRAAIVTGAGSGIGRASAEVLAGAGATVVCADIDVGSAEETAELIRARGGHALAVRCDVADGDHVEALVADAVSSLGRLDVMCNIAGIVHTSAVVDTTEADLDRVIAVNFKGVFFGCRAAARVMSDRGTGSIINMVSAAVDVPAPGLVCYASAKAAAAQLTRTLAIEVAPHGVRVNAVAPGLVVTGTTSRHFLDREGRLDEDRREQTLAAWRQTNPLQLVGQPADIAWAVLYLASDASRYMTGQILRPNGGAAMR